MNTHYTYQRKVLVAASVATTLCTGPLGPETFVFGEPAGLDGPWLAIIDLRELHRRDPERARLLAAWFDQVVAPRLLSDGLVCLAAWTDEAEVVLPKSLQDLDVSLPEHRGLPQATTLVLVPGDVRPNTFTSLVTTAVAKRLPGVRDPVERHRVWARGFDQEVAVVLASVWSDPVLTGRHTKEPSHDEQRQLAEVADRAFDQFLDCVSGRVGSAQDHQDLEVTGTMAFEEELPEAFQQEWETPPALMRLATLLSMRRLYRLEADESLGHGVIDDAEASWCWLSSRPEEAFTKQAHAPASSEPPQLGSAWRQSDARRRTAAGPPGVSRRPAGALGSPRGFAMSSTARISLADTDTNDDDDLVTFLWTNHLFRTLVAQDRERIRKTFLVLRQCRWRWQNA